MSQTVQTSTIETAIPARLDRLPWSRFHWMIIVGLGTAWILDGLEVTMVGAVASRMTHSGSGIDINAGQIGLAASIYVIGACLGALFFGQLCDRFGRKSLFMITLVIYIVATVITAFSFAPWFFYLARFVTGAGIGGEYSAINSAIDELIPARVRGRADLAINGSYWLGSAAGSAAAVFFLSEVFSDFLGWRLSFGVGAVLGLAVLFVRRSVPESPRWLFIHGREDEAERIVDGIEREVTEQTGQQLPEPDQSITVRQRTVISFREIARVAFTLYPRRSILCVALFVGQAFLYNGITFNLGTLMTTFFDVSSGFVPVFLIVYALGNFAGPTLLGRLFDTVGRKPMVSGTYLGSTLLSFLLAGLFVNDMLNSVTFIIIIVAVFFLASSGASAAYLTASEIFPMETRALAIAFFYAIGTAVGGIVGPLLFGEMIGTKQVGLVALAFVIGGAVMALGGIAELFFGVSAEGEQLEDVAAPLTAKEAEGRDGSTPERGEASGHRAEAEQERARAAEHRAAAHEQLALAAGGDERANDRKQIEDQLAEIAEMTARVHDERALAADERADAAHADEAEQLAARERAEAAEQRARAREHEAAELQAAHEADTTRHHELAEAASERARAREQRASAAEQRAAAAPGDEVAAARADLHDAWAAMHLQRARIHEASAEGEPDAQAAARTEAAALAEQARAAEQRAEAAAHRADAAEERHAQASAFGEQEQLSRQRQQAAERAAAEQRVRDRLERQRTGWRRFRPGPGRISGSPGMAVSSALPPADLDRERDAIVRALDEHGVTERRELARLVGARYWGPGVFRAALRQAIDDGRVRRSGRGSYVLSDGDESGQ